MALLDEVKQLVSTLPAELTEKKGVYTFSFIIAERKGFLTKKRLQYIARFRIDDSAREIRFTEMLKESGSGFSAGGGMDDGISTGFGFKKEIYKSGGGGREGTIEEQSNLLGKEYTFQFDLKTIRKKMEKLARDSGFLFKYQITPAGL
ncbi:MAG: hypothetical protein AB1585_19585 [Thermodesulfobacteriota bacterium]